LGTRANARPEYRGDKKQEPRVKSQETRAKSQEGRGENRELKSERLEFRIKNLAPIANSNPIKRNQILFLGSWKMKAETSRLFSMPPSGRTGIF
jgi:hypothetical protein